MRPPHQLCLDVGAISLRQTHGVHQKGPDDGGVQAYNYEFKIKTRTVQISYALKYLEDQKKFQASASIQPVKLDYLIADAGG